MNEAIAIREADLDDPTHSEALVELFESYMRDPLEGGEPPSEEVKRKLVPGLRAHPACHVFFAMKDEMPVGFAVCFLGFSTFNARPLINIHDIFVDASLRGMGIGKKLLDRIEAKTRSLDGCAITLEVRKDNERARRLYRNFGFQRGEIGGAEVEFWRKTIE